jgi:hypothetical protein
VVVEVVVADMGAAVHVRNLNMARVVSVGIITMMLGKMQWGELSPPFVMVVFQAKPHYIHK